MSTEDGFLPLSRSLPNSPIWEMGALAVQIWIWCLQKAVYTEEGYTMDDGLHLERGQFWTTFPLVQKALKYRCGRGYKEPKSSTVKDIFSRLKADRMADYIAASKADPKTDRSGIIVTICNYEKYNPLQTKGRPDSRPNDRPDDRPVDNSKADPKEKRSKEKRVQEQVPPLPPAGKVIHILTLEFPEQPPACELTTLNDSAFEFEPISRQWIAEETPATRDLYETEKEKWGDQVIATIRPYTDEDKYNPDERGAC